MFKSKKKGVLGLSTAQAFLIGILSLAIVGVLSIIVLNSIGSTAALTTTFTITNESGAFINESGYTLGAATAANFGSPVITAIFNSTDSVPIVVANATVNSAGLVTNATAENWDPVLISYTYTTQGDGGEIIANTSSGLVTFFTNVPTWLVLLSVVVIILIIAAVVVVINRFGGASGRTSL